jgi:hypothetical protein
MPIVKFNGPVDTGGLVAVGGTNVTVGVGVALAPMVGAIVGGLRVGIDSVPGAMGGSVALRVAVAPIGCAPPDGAGVAELASEQASNMIDSSIKQISISQRGFIERLL